MGLNFTWESPDINENRLTDESPAALVQRLAETKARKLADDYPDCLIIGSDQVATFDNKILGKPYTYENAFAQLISFRNREVTFMTGLCLLNSTTGRTQSVIEDFTVRFRNLTNKQIENYLHREQPYDCAGSFKSEGLGICLFQELEGKDFNTLIGLPLIALTRMLAKEGMDPLNQETSFFQESS